MLSQPSGKFMVLAGLAGLSLLVGCIGSEGGAADEDEVAYSLRSSLSGSPDAKKTYVCHIPPGNPANAHTIHVGNPAVDAHLAHGDSLGKCESVMPPKSGSGCRGKDSKGGKSIQNVVKRHGHSWKVTLCHIPPGNPANSHTISVGPAAVKAHLAHGDVLGACSTEPETGSSSTPECPETGTGGSGGAGGTGGSGTGGSGTGGSTTTPPVPETGDTTSTVIDNT